MWYQLHVLETETETLKRTHDRDQRDQTHIYLAHDSTLESRINDMLSMLDDSAISTLDIVCSLNLLLRVMTGEIDCSWCRHRSWLRVRESHNDNELAERYEALQRRRRRVAVLQ